jgi:membrane protein implicated in regulation of membrane protease activity
MDILVDLVIYIGLAVVFGWLFADVFVSFFEILVYLGGMLRGKEDIVEPSSFVPVPTTALVTKAIIPPAHGQVKYSGSFWQAVAEEPIPEKATVQVIEKKGLVVYVSSL